jgi:hypothetical protein
MSERRRHFVVVKEITKYYRRFNSKGMQLTVGLTPPSLPNSNPVQHFVDSVNQLFEYALQNSSPIDMVGITIHNEINKKGKPVGISFRRKDQISQDMIWRVFEKVSQSNAPFNTIDTLVVNVH